MGSEIFLEYLKFEKRYSEHTVRAYIDDLKQFTEFASLQKPGFSSESDISYILIRNWIIELHKTGHSSRSINRKLSSLKKYCKFLIISGKIKKNPFDKIISPKSKKSLPGFLNFNEIIALDQSTLFQNDYSGKRDRAIIEILYCTGMRLSELVNLKAEDIDLKSQTVKVIGKRNKERIIPFPKEIIPIIIRYDEEKKNMNFNPGFFFTTDKGVKTYPRMIQRIIKKYLTMVSTSEKKSPHVLRHTYATHLLNNGAEINAIKELLGHANLSATEVYTHNTFQKLNTIYKLAHPRA